MPAAADPAPRHLWSVDVLDPRVGERLLEVGCGHGVAAGLAAARVAPVGQVTAIDRAPAMAMAAAKRNAALVERGLLRVVWASFAEESRWAATAGAERLDGIWAFNVAAFWRPGEAGTSLTIACRRLRPGGRLCLFWDRPDGGLPTPPAGLDEALGSAGFGVERRLCERVGGRGAGGVVARRRPDDRVAPEPVPKPRPLRSVGTAPRRT